MVTFGRKLKTRRGKLSPSPHIYIPNKYITKYIPAVYIYIYTYYEPTDRAHHYSAYIRYIPVPAVYNIHTSREPTDGRLVKALCDARRNRVYIIYIYINTHIYRCICVCVCVGWLRGQYIYGWWLRVPVSQPADRAARKT